jgi:TIR domain
LTRIAEVFFSYAHADEELMNSVRRQMIIYERNGILVKWHDRKIPPGDYWRNTIDERIRHAAVILLFFSPHFIESKYCYEIEGKIALERAKNKSAVVIPIILRPCAWQESPFGELQALPKDGRPVSQWTDVDQVCLDIAQAVKQRATESS